jgi:hypothetical protein
MGNTSRRKEDQYRSRFRIEHGWIANAHTAKLCNQTAALALQYARIWAITSPVHCRQRSWKLISFKHADDRIRRHHPRPLDLDLTGVCDLKSKPMIPVTAVRVT